MPTVTVRYWAAARAAAGTSEEPQQGEDLEQVLAAARAAHGPELARVIERCSFLVDEVRAVPGTRVREGSVVDVLPPFAGGSAPGDAGAGRRADPDLRRQTAAAGAVSLVLVAVTAVAAGAGGGVLLAAVVLAQVALLVGWFPWCGAPGGSGGRVVAGASALAAAALLVPRGAGDVPDVGRLTWVLGPAFVLALLAQLARRAPRRGLVASLTATVAVTALVVLAPVLLAARALADGEDAVLVALSGLAVAALAGRVVPLLPVGRSRSGPARRGVVVGGVLAGAALAGASSALPVGVAAAAGAALAASAALPAAALLVAGGRAARLPAAGVLVAAALPLVLLGATTYAVAPLVLG